MAGGSQPGTLLRTTRRFTGRNMTTTATVFVVLDPTCMEQAALEAGEELVRAYKAHRDIDASLHVYCCVTDESVAVVPEPDVDSARASL